MLQLCADHGLPTPQLNIWIGGHEVDFYWPEASLVLEFDGGAATSTRQRLPRGPPRDRALAARASRCVRVTWRDLEAGRRSPTRSEADPSVRTRR